MSGTNQTNQQFSETTELESSEEQANSNETNSTHQNPTSIVEPIFSQQTPQPINPSSSTTSETHDNEGSKPEGPLLKKAEEKKPMYAPQPNLEKGLKPRISVIGVGGAGCNAITNMIKSELVGVEFYVANTDAQALEQSDAKTKIQLGLEATHGLGAGSHPEMGRASAEESIHDVLQHIGGSHMLFVTAGMGGGTGTGAAPIIAKAAREHGILTVGVITKPFHFEGAKRMRVADAGIEELQKYVDTLIVIPNQNLFRVANEKTTFVDAFKMADEVLYSGVRSVTDLMMKPGLINLDFADVKAVMGEMMGKAMMGTGEADGEGRAIDAAEAAISSPLLDDVSMKGAKAVLINITGGMDMTLFEADEAANRIREEVDPNAHIIFGSTFDESLEGKIRVSCVATGIDAHAVVAASVSSPSSRADKKEYTENSQDSAPQAGTPNATSKVSSIEDELGMGSDKQESSTNTNAESSYDIYSSLRRDMSHSNDGSSTVSDDQMTQERVESEIQDSRVAGTDLPSSFTEPSENQTDHPFQKPQAVQSANPPRPREELEEEEEEQQGFFSRLMGRKKASPKPKPIPERRAQSHPQQQPKRPTSVDDHDDLDVPAFLRRKDRH